MNGQELCRRIKQEQGFDNPLVIGITAADDPGLEAEIRALGADAFFRKPFENEVLVQLIRNVLKW